MPGHGIHRDIKRVILGTTDMSVDEEMDKPVKFLGKEHRVLNHDFPQLISKYGYDPQKLAEGELHILVDRAFSKLPPRTRLMINVMRALQE